MAEPIEGQENAGQQVLEPAVAPVVEPVIPAEPVEAESEKRKRKIQEEIDHLTSVRKEEEYKLRMAEQRRADLEQQQRPVAPAAPKEDMIGEMPRDKWEEWHAENPVDAMRYLSRAEGRSEAEKVKAETMAQMTRAQLVQDTIGEVYKNHPELREVMEGKKAPEEVPFWQVYDEVAREMPDAKFLVKGPIIVMKEAERRVKEREMADRERKISGDAAQKEKERQEQVSAGHTAGSSPRPPGGGAVKLSPEEEKIARKMGMTPEEYAKNKGGK